MKDSFGIKLGRKGGLDTCGFFVEQLTKVETLAAAYDIFAALLLFE